MPQLTYDELTELVAVQADLIARQAEQIKRLSARVAELERRLGSDSSNSSRPPSSDSPYTKRPAKKRSSRKRSGRKPGKQPGDPGVCRALSDDPDEIVDVAPDCCAGCEHPLTGVAGRVTGRRQVVDIPPAPAPIVTEYQLVEKTCPCCGQVTYADWDDLPDQDANRDVLAGAGSPVRIGPATLARCALLTCGHYLPVARATQLLETLSGVEVSTGFTAGARRRAATRLLRRFFPHMQNLLATAPVLHADETTGRADGTLAYVHVACTEYLTLMHVGGRSKEDIDAGGILPSFTGVLVRDGYAGYDHLPALHAWCGAHLLRDLRQVSDADPHAQAWAIAMAETLTRANQAAQVAREHGRDHLTAAVLADITSGYQAALVTGRAENLDADGELAQRARTLIHRFERYQDMILRFTTDLAVPWTNNQAERDVRPVKIQQRTSGGCWRTLQGLIEFAVVHSYLSTATKWGKDKLEALTELFTTGPWLPPALKPAE